MELSKRLQTIVKHIDKCESLADIGTDHGYVPIYCVKNNICCKAVASDINKGPIEKAKLNISMDGLKDKIKCKLGPGLSTLKQNEVEAIVIAGMGGNLTRDILLADIEKVKAYKFAILQPAQNPEVLREFLYNGRFEILDEDICFDEGKYYELFKVKYSKEGSKIKIDDSIEYEISPILLKKRSEDFIGFIETKIAKYENILDYIQEDTISANEKKKELKHKISKLKEIL